MCTLLGSWNPNHTHTYTNLHINIWLTARASRRNLIREADDPAVLSRRAEALHGVG